MGDRPALFLGLLADQPELIAEVGALRWRASGCPGTPGPWIEATSRDAGLDDLPITLVATDLDWKAIGAVTLGAVDESVADVCPSLTPWLVRLVVRPGERRCGVGRLLATAAEDLARQHGHDRVWVAPENGDDVFFRECGWRDDPSYDGPAHVLSKPVG